MKMAAQTPVNDKPLISIKQISKAVLIQRGQKVILDSTLAELYEVDLKVLNQAVKRNLSRFPADFMFQLDAGEVNSLRSQIVTLKVGRGVHRKYLPYVFTEQGVAMLSSVLRSDRAIRVNIDIMRAFVSLRGLLTPNNEIAGKLAALEKKYDSQFKVVFAAIRTLIIPSDQKKKKPIGFAPWA
jgi:hypothetical protein